MEWFDVSNYLYTGSEVFEVAKGSTGKLRLDFFTQHAWFEKKTLCLEGNDGLCYEFPLGLGLLEFCELDFLELAHQCEEYIPEQVIEHPVYSPENRDDLIQYYLERAEESAQYLKPILEAHPYLGAFPPIVMVDDPMEGLEAYFMHLETVQREFKCLLSACFDTAFMEPILGQHDAKTRFFIYQNAAEAQYPKEVKQVYAATNETLVALEYLAGMGEEVPCNAYDIKFGTPPGLIDLLASHPDVLRLQYVCESLYSILSVSFYQMIEQNVKLKRCKRCGRYFILKGKHESDYCARPRAGQKKTCQSLAATEHFKEKLSDNQAYSLFTTYYKRYHSRMKAGRITPAQFKRWNVKGVRMREHCIAGEISIEEFESWLVSSFENHKKPKVTDATKSQGNKTSWVRTVVELEPDET